jgi:hypothetical protein
MTFTEFLAKATELGVRIDEVKFSFGPDTKYLVRPVAGDDPLWCPCPKLMGHERITGDVIEEICDALGLKMLDFGIFRG